MKGMRLEDQHTVPVIGLHKVTVFDFHRNMAKASSVERQIQGLIAQGRPHRNRKQYEYLTEKLKDLCAENEETVKNLVALRTRSIIAQRLGSVNTYSLNLTHGAVGTGTATPLASDTQLAAEIARVEKASVDDSNVDNGIIIISFFWSRNSFANAAVAEFGNFVDATASANSGRLSSHILFSGTINKTAQKTLTVDSTYTVTSG